VPSIELISVGQQEPSALPSLPFAVRAEAVLHSNRDPSLFQHDFDQFRGCIYHLGSPFCDEAGCKGPFFAWDPTTSEAPVDWSDQDVANRAKAEPGVVVICPVRDFDVPVDVTIWETEPHVTFNAWQHVVEAPLRTTGLIEIHECTGEAKACFTVEPGEYTVRALFQGLQTVSEDGLKGADFYEIQIWKAPCESLRVIRLWK